MKYQSTEDRIQNATRGLVAILVSVMLLAVPFGKSSVSLAAPVLQSSRDGVIVERVAGSQAGDRAQLQKGDILQSWSYGSEQGTLATPFDWEKLEVENASVHEVVLKGLRNDEARDWKLPLGDWGVQVRPPLPPQLLRLYQEAQRHAQAEEWREAVSSWRTVADRGQAHQPAWLRAWILLRAAEALSAPATWPEAADFYKKAAEQAVIAGPELETWVQRSWGNALEHRRDWSASEQHYERALALSSGLAEGNLQSAGDLDHLGAAAHRRFDLDKAEKLFSQAMVIQQRLAPHGTGMAESFIGLGNVAQRRNQADLAEKYQRRAFELLQQLGPNSLQYAQNLAGLGNIAYVRGELDNAEHYYLEALQINSRDKRDLMSSAANLNNLAAVSEQRGDFAEAEKRFREALAIKEKLAPDSLELASSLQNVGVLAFERGDWESAEKFFRRSLPMFERHAPESWYVAVNLHTLTMIVLQTGDLKSAEALARRSLAIRQRIVPGSLELSGSLNDLGNVALAKGDLAGAEKYFLDALELEQKIAPDKLDVAETFNSLGDVAWKAKDLAKAEDYYRRAKNIRETLAPGSTLLAESLADLAGVLQQREKPEEAMDFFQRALDALENQTAKLGGSDAVRSSFRAKHTAYYKDYVDLLVQQGKPEMALKVLERFRARTLLEMLAVARVDIQKGVDPDLLKRKTALQRDLKKESDARIRLLQEKHTDEQVKASDAKAAALLAQYEEVKSQIRSSSPAYAALTQPQPLSADEVQRQILDADTLLLEYSLGERRSYLFLLSKDSLEAVELPGRKNIEGAARGLYDLLAQRKQVVRGETNAQRESRMAAGEQEFAQKAAVLSRMVLGKVASKLGNKRLLVVADGALAYIPFAVLPEPANSPDGARSPLIARHEIVYLPSASVLAVLRRQGEGRERATRAVAVLADPVFDRDDPRVIENKSAAAAGGARQHDGSSDENLSRSAEDLGLVRGARLKLPRLRFSRREAEAIVAAEPAEQTMEALDFRANRSLATSPELGQYRVVHFATHGFLNSKHPEFSGLVLSLVDKNGKPQMGFLGLEDIYNLKLNADLVVLSACETGLGKEISGEGLVGLTRGFMYAGTGRVVASLWKVSDAATAELMAAFYRAMAKEGLPPAAALRQAQLHMLKQKRWKAPYYWAAFQVQGEWK